MIIGIGHDLCEIPRIDEALRRFGERFSRRCFTELERARADVLHERAAFYAKRFAAKEACAKALGTGIAKGISWRDIGVVNLPTGAPGLQLSGAALLRLQTLIPAGYRAQIHLSLTDDFSLASAFVVIEALQEA